MRIPDDLLDEWYRLVLEQAGAPDGDPLEAKLALARFIVTRSHGEEAAREAEAHFTRVVREGTGTRRRYRSCRFPTGIPCICRPCWPRRSACRRARRAA